MIKKRVFYGWKYESLEEKAKWFSSLSVTKRYETMLAMSELYNLTHKVKKRQVSIGKGSFKTVQILNSSWQSCG